jgi:hypothetical protein
MFREITTAYSEKYMKHINTLSGQNSVFLNVKAGCIYCGIFAQSKNCGARETSIANEQLWNNIRF